MIAELADIILPRTCVVCGKRLDRHERHLCIHCQADMPLTYTWTMERNRMADKFNGTLQRDIESYEPYIFASSLFFYNGEANYRKIPHSIKYHGNISLGRAFGDMLGQKIAEAGHLADIDLVVPVPLHWTRAWSRGYNQAEVIATSIAKRLNSKLSSDLLYRRRKTRTQTKLDVGKKATNVENAFAIRSKGLEKAVRGNARHILIVDDVFTTGATLKACYKALRRHFPPSVRISVATLCLVGD